MDRRLTRLADAVLQPGFVGTTPPDWLRRRLGEGLGSVALYARNIVDPAQVAALTAALRAESPDVIVAIDEEAGDVTRLEAHTGSSRPGNLALGAADDPELTTAVARHLGARARRTRHHARLRPRRRRQLQPGQPGHRRTGLRLRPRTGRPAHRGLDPGPAVRRRGRVRQALPRPRRHRGRLAPRRPSHRRRPGRAGRLRAAAVPRRDRRRREIDHDGPPGRTGDRSGPPGHAVPCHPDRPAARRNSASTGLIVTDAIEMQAVARRYGLAGATVAAIAAGADAVCVGGEHADEATAIELRDAIVAAVVDGNAARGAPGRRRRPGRRPGHLVARAASAGAASGKRHRASRAAGRATGTARTGRRSGPAVAADRTGVRRRALPHRQHGHRAGNPVGRAGTAGRPDARHEGARITAPAFDGDPRGRRRRSIPRCEPPPAGRSSWRSATPTGTPGCRRRSPPPSAARPDTIVVEMGVPAGQLGANQISTYGASTACGIAAAELLAGVVPAGVLTEPLLTA